MVAIYLANASRHRIIFSTMTIEPDGKPVRVASWASVKPVAELSLPFQTRYSAMNDLYLWVRAYNGSIKDYAVRLTGDDVSTETLTGTTVRFERDALYFTVHHTFEPWTSRLPDDRMLHQVTIPGTHDSATHELGLSSQCQYATVPQQLYIGVRYFDIRLDTDEPDDPWIVHASVKTSYRLSDIARMFAAFLDGAYGLLSKDETVVVQLKVDHGLDDDAHTDRIIGILKKGFAKVPNGLFLEPIRMDGTIPTMADLRGKLVVLRRYEADDQNGAESCTPVKYFAKGEVYNQWSRNPGGKSWEQVFNANRFEWPDKGASLDDYRNLHGLSFVIQDNYTAVGDRLGNKWPLITAFLQAAGDQKKPDSWYLNFTSSAWYSPVYEASLINPKLLDWLKTAPAKPGGHGYGTILMDFVTSELVDAWVQKNF